MGISQEGHVGVGADRFLLFFFKANGLPASWLHINRKQFPQLMWACCGFSCVCMCVSCSDSQQDSLITEESKGCIFLIQKLDTWDSERYFKKEIQNDDAHLLGPYIKKEVWVKKKWRRLDHYCLWGHEHKGMVLLFYVKKKKKREREREASSSCGKLWNSTTSSISDAFQSTSGNLLTDIYYPKPHHPRPQKETLCLVHKGTMVWERFAFSTWSFLSKPP